MKSAIEVISEKVDEMGPEYMALVVITMKLHAAEKAHLKPEDVLPLFFKRFDEHGVVMEVAINGEHPKASEIPNGFDVSLEEINDVLDKIENNPNRFREKFEVMLIMDSVEQMVSNRISNTPWVMRRIFERVYEDETTDIPTAFRFHFTADAEFIKTQFPELENHGLISSANN